MKLDFCSSSCSSRLNLLALSWELTSCKIVTKNAFCFTKTSTDRTKLYERITAFPFIRALAVERFTILFNNHFWLLCMPKLLYVSSSDTPSIMSHSLTSILETFKPTRKHQCHTLVLFSQKKRMYGFFGHVFFFSLGKDPPPWRDYLIRSFYTNCIHPVLAIVLFGIYRCRYF